MNYYRIIHPATGKVVNLYSLNSSSAVKNGEKLLLYSWLDNDDQKWGMESKNGKILLRLKRDTNKVMNRNSNTNEAIVWNYSDDTETNADSLIYQEVSSDGYNRIRLDGRGLYLTKNENNNYLCWMSKISSNRQNFKLELVESGQTRISMPVNVNQKYTANDPWIRDYGCAVCCGVDVASWFNKKNYSLSDFKVNVHYYENKNGYQWTGPDGFNFESAVSTASESEAQTIEHIRQYVDSNTPIACHAVGSGGEHWFVAFETTTAAGTTWKTAGINVLDPFNKDDKNRSGREVPIYTAMYSSSVLAGIDKIRVPRGRLLSRDKK